jgi:hypothetical protein
MDTLSALKLAMLGSTVSLYASINVLLKVPTLL